MSDTLDPPVADTTADPDNDTVGNGAPSAPERESLPVGRGAWRGLRPLLMRLHFYVGVFVGPFILLAAVTGLIYTITPQLDQLLYRDALTVPTSSTTVDLRAQVAAAAAAVPDGKVIEIRPAPDPASTTRVSFDVPGVAQDYTGSWERTAFVDPHTGQVRAVLDTAGEWLPTRAWLDSLHRNLHLGQVGRVYSELAASWLWVLTASGLALWVVRRRRRAKLRRTLLPQHSSRGRPRLRSWHGAVGLWAAVGMLFLSATGLTWSHFAGDNVTALRSAMSWKTPSVSQTLPATTAPTPAPSTPTDIGATADRVLAGARPAGLSDPVAITPTEKPGKAWTVSQVQRSWPEKQDSASVDPSSGAVIDTVRFADWPIAAKLARWGVDSHMGLLFGWVNQVILAVLALGLICVVVWGYRRWWLRRPTRPGATAPGGTERPGVAAVALLGAVAVVVGIAFPELGASLLVFVLGDAIRQELRHRRPAD